MPGWFVKGFPALGEVNYLNLLMWFCDLFFFISVYVHTHARN